MLLNFFRQIMLLHKNLDKKKNKNSKIKEELHKIIIDSEPFY